MRGTTWIVAGMLSSAGLAVADPGAGVPRGPEWEEPCDAGNLPANATPVTGPLGFVEIIEGEIGECAASGGDDFQDMFLVRIAIPSMFSATVEAKGTDFDPELWLFDFGGTGRLGNDDDAAGGPFPGFGRMADDGSGVEITVPGLYYLAISGHDSNPVSDLGEIFDQATRTEISGNDGAGGMAAISGWDAEGEIGVYRIRLAGVEFIVCPADVNADGFVDFADLLRVLSAWGPCAGCPEDIDETGFVDFDDLLIVLSTWGRCE